MDKFWFAQRVFDKVSKPITSIDDGSAEASLFERHFESALRVTIEDTGGKEFDSPYRPALVFTREDVKNPYSNRVLSPPLSPFYIYRKDRNVVGFADQQLETPEFAFSESYRSPFGVKYYPFYDPASDQNLIASGNQNLTIKVLFFKKNVALWSTKALEAAICYCAYLIAPEVAQKEGEASKHLRDYSFIVDQYKIYNTIPGNYQSPIPKYSPLSPQNVQNFSPIPTLGSIR